MRVIARPILIRFWNRHKDAEQPLRAWFQEARKAQWKDLNDIKRQYGNASILKNRRVVFDIGGNKFRLVVAIHCKSQFAFIRSIGTHQEYDSIDAENI